VRFQLAGRRECSVDFTYTARISRPPSPASYCPTLESGRVRREDNADLANPPRGRSSARKSRQHWLGINATVSTYRQAMSTREPRTARIYSPREGNVASAYSARLIAAGGREIPGRRGALGKITRTRRLIRSKACNVRGDFRGSLVRT